MLRFALTFFVLVLFLSACVGRQPIVKNNPLVADDFRLSEDVRASIEAEIKESGFSGVVGIAQGGQLIFSSAHGYEQRVSQRPNKVNTRFALASVGKLYTAIAIHQLVERGHVKLSDPVGRFLPNYANSLVRDQVTVQHLLKMRSGLGDIFDVSCEDPKKTFVNHADYFCLFENEPPMFEPGSEFSYSNAGYIVLGRIIEVASGQNFYNYIEQNIFTPSGMTSAAYDDVDVIEPGTAVGYRYEGFDGIPERAEDVRGLLLVSNNVKGRGTAAGGGYATVGDFAGLDEALRSGQILSPKSLGNIFSEGFIRGERHGGLAGGAPGMTTRYRLLSNGVSITAFGNTDLPSAPELVGRIEEYLN